MKITIDRKRFQFYAWVGLGWTLLWLFNHLIENRETFSVRIPNEVWRAVYLVPVLFFFFEYAWPFITKKKKTLLLNFITGFFLLGIWMILVSYGMYGWRQLGIELHIYTLLRQEKTIYEAVSYQAQGGIAGILFFGIIKHMYDYQKLKQAAQQMRIEKQEAELNYLKSQTNPHFLFNTLNNIYALARDKSDLAPESILRLSKILRFMLYETGGAYISIEQEIKIIGDYIALEKLRYDDSLRITFNHDIEEMKQALPPLLLIPLVENAFKHGVSETRNLPFIDIDLSVSQQQLTFFVKNSVESSAQEGGVKESIGLTNLRRQLELLYTDYNLSVQREENEFTAILKINLASHV